ncbi:gluconokinase [Thermomonospora amylolytica]|uniref:gluconokinase n=1 Tax=Thermomonospora amylolytica TaxID=1411117 RepID=UPI000E6CD4B0|nr:gluconokinase [Thermomonospora amylolytica]
MTAPAGNPPVIVVMGVSGSGKSTVGRMLAQRLGREFGDADDLHSPGNVDKMGRGVPLTDEDRWPWLREVARWIEDRVAANVPAVMACSALKREYRRLLIPRTHEVRLVYLKGDRDLIARRMAARRGHFFKPDLLDSQFRDLEPPGPDEDPITVDAVNPAEEIVRRIVEALDADG